MQYFPRSLPSPLLTTFSARDAEGVTGYSPVREWAPARLPTIGKWPASNSPITGQLERPLGIENTWHSPGAAMRVVHEALVTLRTPNFHTSASFLSSLDTGTIH